jgi:hypothetical protein
MVAAHEHRHGDAASLRHQAGPRTPHPFRRRRHRHRRHRRRIRGPQPAAAALPELLEHANAQSPTTCRHPAAIIRACGWKAHRFTLCIVFASAQTPLPATSRVPPPQSSSCARPAVVLSTYPKPAAHLGRGGASLVVSAARQHCKWLLLPLPAQLPERTCPFGGSQPYDR